MEESIIGGGGGGMGAFRLLRGGILILMKLHFVHWIALKLLFCHSFVIAGIIVYVSQHYVE